MLVAISREVAWSLVSKVGVEALQLAPSSIVASLQSIALLLFAFAFRSGTCLGIRLLL